MKKLVITTVFILTVSMAAADMEFRSSSDIQVFSPFNMNSNVVSNVGDPSDDSDALTQGYADNRYLQRSGDSMQGSNSNLDMNDNRIQNLASPSSGTDAANKNYVDTQVGSTSGVQNLSEVLEEGSIANQSIDMDGSEVTNLNIPSTPSDADSNDAVPVGYLQDNYVASSGGRLTGDLTANGNDIRNLGQISGQSSINDSIEFASDQIIFTQENGGEKKVLTVDETGNLTVGGSIDVNSSRITDVADPVNSQDVVTLSYFNSNDASGTDNQTLSVSGNQIQIQNGNKVYAPYSNNTDKLDGVQLVNIDWADVALQRSDVAVSDLEPADSNLDMNGNNVNMGGGNITSGSNEMCLGDSC